MNIQTGLSLLKPSMGPMTVAGKSNSTEHALYFEPPGGILTANPPVLASFQSRNHFILTQPRFPHVVPGEEPEIAPVEAPAVVSDGDDEGGGGGYPENEYEDMPEDRSEEVQAGMRDMEEAVATTAIGQDEDHLAGEDAAAGLSQRPPRPSRRNMACREQEANKRKSLAGEHLVGGQFMGFIRLSFHTEENPLLILCRHLCHAWLSLCHSGDGLTVLNGKRKSTRGHQRPLEYWRNEHKVFGRDHKSE